MGNKAVLGLLVVAALVGIFLLLGGPAWLDGALDGASDPAAGGGDGSLLPGGGSAAADAPDSLRSPGPVLFGRTRAERVGTGALDGRVMDFKTGEPVAGASVTVAGVGYGGEQTAMQVRTDASGAFLLRDLPAGDGYTLHVAVDAGLTRTQASVSVAANRLNEAGTLWLGQRGVLRGRVVEADDTPVAGVDVQVYGGGASMLEMLQNLSAMLEELDKDAVPQAQTRTDAQGRFEIAAVDPGPLTLVVRGVGYQQVIEPIVMTDQGASGGDVTIRVEPSDAITGIVVDERGRGIANARVACLEKNKMESVFYGRQYSLTDATGHFRIESPPTRAGFAVIVTAAGYPTLFTEARGGESQRFVLVGGLEVVLRVVEFGTGAPVEGAQLTAMFSASLQALNTNMAFVTGTTDARGEVSVLARPGKLAMLFLNHAERGSAMYSPMNAMVAGGTLRGPKDATISRANATLEFSLLAGVEVSGRVTDEDENPVAGARCLTIGAMGFGGRTLTDADGRYVLKGQSAPVSMVLVSKPGYVQVDPLAGNLAARTGEEQITHDVALRRSAVLMGRVLGPDKRPVAGVRVRAAADPTLAMIETVTGAKESITSADGRYVIDGVQRGKTTRVIARHPGFLDSQTEEFEVGSAVATKAPDLVLALGSHLDVLVRLPAGAPGVGARIEIGVQPTTPVTWDAMGQFQGFADVVAGADGTARIHALPAGTVTVTVSKTGFAPGRAVLEGVGRDVNDGEHAVEVRLRRATVVRGRVLGPDDAPLAGASVDANPAPAQDGATVSEGAAWVPRRSATTDAQGRFELDPMPEAAFELRVHAKGHLDATQLVVPGRGDIEIRLQAMSGDAAARITAIDAELMRIYGAFQSVKDDGERQALAKRMQALQQEKRELEGK